MASIPIVLTPVPVPVGVQAININQLLQVITNYLTASIDVAGVSFFLQGTVNPSSDVGLFFNTEAEQFFTWNSSIGAYQPVTDLQVGDMKYSYVSGDDFPNGWVALDGRTVAGASPGLSAAQQSNLQAIFGVGGTLPTITLSGPPVSSGKVFVGFP